MRRGRRRMTALLGAVAVVVGLLPALAGSPAAAQSLTWPRVDRFFDGVVLRTRGYYPDGSCIARALPCLTASGRYRPEATAQAKAIRRLSEARFDPVVPDDYSISAAVQWEVAPKPDQDYAPAHDSPEPPDPNDDDLPQPQLRWRVDIVVDDSPDPSVRTSSKPGILEVKRWRGDDTRDQVRNQLGRYEREAFSVGVTFTRNDELNRQAWSEAYLDSAFPPRPWCVWADADVLNHRGNVYFAPLAETPQDVRDLGPCDVPDEPTPVFVEPRRRQKATDSLRLGRYEVTACQAATPRTLQFVYNGTSETRTVPAGTGCPVYSFSHRFASPGGVSTQRATILETGEFAEATTQTVDVVTVSGGNAQTAMAGRFVFSQPLRAVVTDSAGNPVPGAAPTFSIDWDGASYQPGGWFPGDARAAVAVTGANGVATAPTLESNYTQGLVRVSAAVPTVAPAMFSLTIGPQMGTWGGDGPAVGILTVSSPPSAVYSSPDSAMRVGHGSQTGLAHVRALGSSVSVQSRNLPSTWVAITFSPPDSGDLNPHGRGNQSMLGTNPDGTPRVVHTKELEKGLGLGAYPYPFLMTPSTRTGMATIAVGSVTDDVCQAVGVVVA